MIYTFQYKQSEFCLWHISDKRDKIFQLHLSVWTDMQSLFGFFASSGFKEEWQQSLCDLYGETISWVTHFHMK